MEQIRPPEKIRPKLDIGYSFEKQDLILFEIRPKWNNPSEKMSSPFAKAKFIKSKDCWNLFWMRASFKWERYKPCPAVKTVKEFIRIVEEDKYYCFYG